MPVTPAEILLINDHPAGVEFNQSHLLQERTSGNLHVVQHGGKAISFLHREGEFVAAPRPDLILIDLATSRRDDFGVLKHVQSDPNLRDIPVVILSSRDAQELRMNTAQYPATAWMTKPPGLEQLISLIDDLRDEYCDSITPSRDGASSLATPNYDTNRGTHHAHSHHAGSPNRASACRG